MPRMCEKCGKKTTFGNTIARRGRAKYLGGVGVKTTGVTRRKFIPNLQKVRVKEADGTVKRIVICAQCLRTANIVKPPIRPKREAIQAMAAANVKSAAKAKAKAKVKKAKPESTTKA